MKYIKPKTTPRDVEPQRCYYVVYSDKERTEVECGLVTPLMTKPDAWTRVPPRRLDNLNKCKASTIHKIKEQIFPHNHRFDRKHRVFYYLKKVSQIEFENLIELGVLFREDINRKTVVSQRELQEWLGED